MSATVKTKFNGTTFAEADAYLAKRASATIANNTRLQREGADAIALILHATAIIAWKRSGAVTLNSGGWRTVTTRNRLRQHMPHWMSLSVKGGGWTVEYTYSDNSGGPRAVAFYDGITLHADGGEPEAPNSVALARGLTRKEAVAIAEQWHSVMTWSDPGVCMYALSSTGKVQSEEHRANLLRYIESDCLPDCELEDLESLRALALYVKGAKLEPVSQRA